jgi:uncharacterized membrane protein YgcG
MAGGTRGEGRPRSDVREALPLGPRSRVAIGALGLLVFVDLLALVPDIELRSVAQRALAGERIPFADLQSVDSHLSSVGLAQLVLTILAGIAFLLWFSRAYRNVIAMGIRRPRYGTRWAVGSWFVPFVNLVIPKKASNDIDRGSDPEMAYGDPDFAARPVSPLLHWWWAAWLLAGFLSRGAGGSANTAQDVSTEATFYIVADIVDVIAAALAIAVILRITRRNEERRGRFEVNQAMAAQRDADAGGGDADPPVDGGWPSRPESRPPPGAPA